MSTPWHLGRLAVLDTETTGVDVETDRIVTACVGNVGGGAGMHIRTWLANPGIPIPEAAAAVHGITTEHAQQHGQDAASVIAEILDALADAWAPTVPLVVMNAPFDLTLLDRESRRHGMGPLRDHGPVIDPLVLDRQTDRWRKGKRTLTDLCRHYDVPLGGAHDAREDALAAARVAWRIASRNMDIWQAHPDELHGWQVEWAAAQAADFAAYLRRQGKPAGDVSGEWPLRHLVPVEVAS
jgi:DNA polymerase-3 subunit epsilon